MSFKYSFLEKRSIRVDLALYRWLIDDSAAPIGISRSQVQHWIDDGFVNVNGKPINKNHMLVIGDQVEFIIPEKAEKSDTPTPRKTSNIKVEVIFEDEYLAVINKPKGLVVHGAPGHIEATLVDILSTQMELSDIGDPDRLGVVHRLDKNTSGIMLIAKDNGTHNLLSQQFEKHQIDKRYRAIVFGTPRASSGLMDFHIDRHKTNRVRMAVDPAGRDAKTIYSVLASYGDFSELELILLTGRTHQIRVHLEKLGHPVVGDDMYGRLENARWFDFLASKDLRNAPKVWKVRWDTPESIQRLNDLLEKLPGQFLHAFSIAFKHPQRDISMQFNAPLPLGWDTFIKMLKFGNIDE